MKVVFFIVCFVASVWSQENFNPDVDIDGPVSFSSKKIVRSIIEENRAEELRAMLVLGVDADLISHADIPLVIHAAVVQNNAAMRVLCEAEANLNVIEGDGWTPLMFAAGAGNLEMLNLLLEWNADPFLANHAGNNALTIAKSGDHQEVAARLVEGCVNYAVSEGQFELLKQALAAGGNANQIINGDNDVAYTPLIFLCSEGSIEEVTEFLELYGSRVDVNQAENDGWNCADFAISREDAALQKVLKGAGALPKRFGGAAASDTAGAAVEEMYESGIMN